MWKVESIYSGTTLLKYATELVHPQVQQGSLCPACHAKLYSRTLEMLTVHAPLLKEHGLQSQANRPNNQLCNNIIHKYLPSLKLESLPVHCLKPWPLGNHHKSENRGTMTKLK